MKQELIDQLLLVTSQEANRLGLPITITVVDTGGHVRAMLRQEGCSYFALESSRHKAITASQLRLPSHIVGEMGQKFPALQASFMLMPTYPGFRVVFPSVGQASSWVAWVLLVAILIRTSQSARLPSLLYRLRGRLAEKYSLDAGYTGCLVSNN